MISYEKLWETMKNKGVSQYALIKKYGVSPGPRTDHAVKTERERQYPYNRDVLPDIGL